MASDPYATGQALLMLAQLDTSHKIHQREQFQRGIRYLLQSQQPDGSWHVVTRSKPVQVYFDNGDPHGKDQFISMMATCWSTAALANFAATGKQPLESFQVALRNKSRAIEN
jgi:N-acyl-D-amino-acid deacylase